MAKFFYKAKKGPTEIVQGELDAENEDQALGKLAAQGLIPIRLGLTPLEGGSKPQAASRESAAPSLASPSPGKAGDVSKIKIRRRDFDILTRQFAILLRANVPLLRIFSVLQTQAVDPQFKMLLVDIQDKIRAGSSLSDALRNYPRVFSQLYVSMIEAGEVSGMLDAILVRLADFSEKEAEIRSRVQAALIYPLFLLGVGLLTVFALMTFILPRLMVVFQELDTELPAITKAVMAASHFLAGHWLPIVVGITGAILLFRTHKVSDAWKVFWDPLSLKIPIFGDLITKTETARFLRSLQLLYENGIPLFRAASVSARTVDNAAIRKSLEALPSNLQGGSTLTQSLQQIPYISSFVVNMVSVGEESGKLGDAVQETASFYESESAQVVKVATTLLEPLMIFFIGGLIGFIVIAMLLPIFEISAGAH